MWKEQFFKLKCLKVTRYRSENNFIGLSCHQNNCIEISSMISNAANNFNILTTSLLVLHNYFDPIKLFSNLYLVKVLNTK